MPSTDRRDTSKSTGFFDTLPERVQAMAMSVKLEQAINLSRRSVSAKAEAILRGLGYGG